MRLGAVFEKRLIEQYIEEHGTEPGTEEELALDDLIHVKTSRVVRPRPPTLTSIPALLATFQNEWDSAALQIFGLEQEVVKLRKELSNALYQNDAAIRVIARLTQERDEARDALSKVTVTGGAATDADEMAIDSAEALPEELGEKVDATQKECVGLIALSVLAINNDLDYQRAARSGHFPKVGRPPTILPPSRPSPRTTSPSHR